MKVARLALDVSSTVRVVAAAALLLAAVAIAAPVVFAQGQVAIGARDPAAKTFSLPAVPANYVIGPDDVLTIVFWREKEMSGDVTVRPDGRISLPLINDVKAAGLTPEQLRAALSELAGKYLEQPSVAVIVKQANSLRVFITGEIEKPGPYPLTTPTTVMQLIAMAGGLKEYADRKNIVVMRVEDGVQKLFKFDYNALSKRRNVRDNIQLKPGDTVIVP